MINVIRVTKHQDHEKEVLFRFFYNGKLERNIFLPDYMADEFEERLSFAEEACYCCSTGGCTSVCRCYKYTEEDDKATPEDRNDYS